MRCRLHVNGHHIYTWRELLPFLFIYRIGTGGWHIAFSEKFVEGLTHDVTRKVIRNAKKARSL